MKYNFKNCRVVINAGTEVLKIGGIDEPRPQPAETMAGVTIQRTFEDYGVFMASLESLHVGDRVRVPAFRVPAVEIDGAESMSFEEISVKDEYATVYDIEGEQIHLVFDRALFQSAIDNNDTKAWPDTQLARYLRGAFLDALRKETSAADCGLLRKEDLWGDNEYFKNVRNRVCYDKDEDSSVWYWTETPENEEASAALFCRASNYGNANYYSASYAGYCVRPRFIIHKS